MYSPNKMMGSISNAITGGNTNLFGGFGSTGLPAQQMTNVPPAQQIPQAVQQPVQQITPSPINPNVLGGFDPQKLTGVPKPTQSFDNTMPQGSALAKKKCNKKY